jgi:hypothetical protein
LPPEGTALQRQLWGLAGQAVGADPRDTAPRLYLKSLNEMIDQQTVRVAGLNNRVPTEVLLLEVIGSAIAMFLLGLHWAFSAEACCHSCLRPAWSQCCSSPCSISTARPAASSRSPTRPGHAPDIHGRSSGRRPRPAQ